MPSTLKHSQLARFASRAKSQDEKFAQYFAIVFNHLSKSAMEKTNIG